MLNIAICEDEKIWQDQLTDILKKQRNECSIDIYTSGEALLEGFYLSRYDLIFMDIYLKGKNGVETITEIRKIDPNVIIAFTTTSQDYALEGYRLKVARYLEKPIIPEDVAEILAIAVARKNTRPLISLNINRNVMSFSDSQILYLEQKNHSINLHLQNDKVLTFTGKLDTVEASFPKPPFYRCHKSFLVNLSQVESIEKETHSFIMKDGSAAYIKREKFKEAGRALDDYMFNKLRESTK